MWLCSVVSGNYKVQAYDQNVKDYMPVSPGIGMHVEVKDPSDKIVLSRVSLSLYIMDKYVVQLVNDWFKSPITGISELKPNWCLKQASVNQKIVKHFFLYNLVWTVQ